MTFLPPFHSCQNTSILCSESENKLSLQVLIFPESGNSSWSQKKALLPLFSHAAEHLCHSLSLEDATGLGRWEQVLAAGWREQPLLSICMYALFWWQGWATVIYSLTTQRGAGTAHQLALTGVKALSACHYLIKLQLDLTATLQNWWLPVPWPHLPLQCCDCWSSPWNKCNKVILVSS